jgi:sugar lactone lactonase YvrE
VDDRRKERISMTRLLLVLAAAATFAATAVAGTSEDFPKRINLPNGFQPEGIANERGTFYVGSIPTGAVYRGSLRTGRGAILVEAREGRSAIGLKVSRGLLFVAGGETGRAFVYNAESGEPVATYRLSTGGSFINDVVVTEDAAWFTDSFKPVLYRLPLRDNGRPGPRSGLQTVTLSGDYVHQDGFNVNGIDATPDGQTLVIVQSSTGTLFTVTPAGVATKIDLGSESVPNGDGILLDGRQLYVVQNQLNVVAKISLAQDLASGRVVRRIRDRTLDVPTTAADLGNRLYVVNARFGTPPTPNTRYWITQLRKGEDD